MKIVQFGAVLLFFFVSLASAKPVLKAATYGDSLAAGFLGDTDLLEPIPKRETFPIKWDLLSYYFSRNDETLKNYCRPDLAWPQRLAELLSKQLDRPVTMANYAVPAAETEDLITQVRTAVAKEREDIAFFWIGHNDLCGSRKKPERRADLYLKDYDRAIQLWNESHEGATAFLLPVGNIPKVFETLEKFPWGEKGNKELTCTDAWKHLFPYCSFYSRKLKRGVLEKKIGSQIEAMNDGLETFAGVWTKKSKRNKYIYLKGLLEVEYEPKDFATDCFHLSPRGAKEWANAVKKECDGKI